MKFYKLRHKPTGLFYKPSNFAYGGNKSNLSEKGKVYIKKPSIRNMCGLYVSHKQIKKYNLTVVARTYEYQQHVLPCDKQRDFEIVEYEVKEGVS